jgi:oxygen-independent coproporphyrinogen III oxidase
MTSHWTTLVGLLERSVPRYTSYPTVAHFQAEVGGKLYDSWLATLPTSARLAVYVHVPYCERLCWFCAARTQGVTSAAKVQDYVDLLCAEIARTAAMLPAGARVERLYWGGGSPTLLTVGQIEQLAGAIARNLTLAEGCEFCVEVDPSATPEEKLAVLVAIGMTRASLAVQDFSVIVQQAIGRQQSLEATRATVEWLRAHGLHRWTADMLYGLPKQTLRDMADTLQNVVAMAPDRISLGSYAHVPWMAKRQRMIPEEALPDLRLRLQLNRLARDLLEGVGYRAIGIDHFVARDDTLARAAAEGRLRRSLEGYTDDAAVALIGFGASAVSRFPQGYVQNPVRTGGYCERVAAGAPAGAAGFALSLEDRVRGRAIEMLMCDFAIDLGVLRDEFGDFVRILETGCREAATRYAGHVVLDEAGLRIVEEAPLIARLVARRFDSYTGPNAQLPLAI